jgi:hypothetical protein
LLLELIDHEETASALRGAAVTSNKSISYFGELALTRRLQKPAPQQLKH